MEVILDKRAFYVKAFGDVAWTFGSPDGDPKPRTYSWLTLGGTAKAWAKLKEQWEFTRTWQEPKAAA